MWLKSHLIITKEVTAAQMWKLFSDVNNWHQWDDGIEYAKMESRFEKGSFFILKPKGAAAVQVEMIEALPNQSFLDVTRFPLTKMYDLHSFEETPDGLKITDTITVKGWLWFVWVQLVAANIVAGLPNEMRKQIAWAKTL